MAKQKVPPPPAEDIPAWFMTYSDVITLLMTFFILLLTFSTTEPEKFDKVQISTFGAAGATGVAGHVNKELEKQAWVQRVRPRAARIAMHGSEIPPMTDEPSSASVGRGLETVSDEEAERDVMTSNSFQVQLAPLVNENANLTPRGEEIAAILARQLGSLPVHCTIEFSNQKLLDRATRFLVHLYDVERVRPGQVGVALADGVSGDSVRFVMERYEK
jgi:flagellar motor protein MotB